MVVPVGDGSDEESNYQMTNYDENDDDNMSLASLKALYVQYDLTRVKTVQIGDKEYKEIGNEPVNEDFEQFIEELRQSKQKKKRERESSCFHRLIDKTSALLSNYNKIWSEILFEVIDYFQILGLIWILPLNLPHLFYQVFRFTLYFNLDFIHSKKPILNALHFVPEQFKNTFPSYLIEWLLYLLVIALWWLLPRTRLKLRMQLTRVVYAIVYLLYAPFVMYVMEYGVCGATNSYGRFRCDFFSQNSHHYGLSRSIPYLVLALLCIAAIHVILLWTYNYNLIMYRRSGKHEKQIQSIETEYAMGMSKTFMDKAYYMINSYHRSATYYMTHIRYMQKLCIVIVLCAVPSQNKNNSNHPLIGNFNDEYNWIMGLSTMLLLALPLLFELYLKPYRVMSSLIVRQLLGWTNVINAFFGWMKATNVQNPFLVDRYLSVIMLVINWTAFGLVVLLTVTWLLLFRLQWKINGSVIKELKSNSYKHYIEAIEQGNLLYEHAQSTHPMFVRCDLIRKHKFLIKQFYYEAVKQRNPLELTLEDTVLKLEEEHHVNQRWSILPHRPLQKVLPRLRRQMDQRDLKHILMSFDKRVILLKILAFCAFRDLLTQTRSKQQQQQTPQ